MRGSRGAFGCTLNPPELLLFLAAVCWSVASASDQARYKVVPRVVVEARLGRYGGKDQQREETLKAMFTEAGCGEQLSEQAVKGKFPALRFIR